ncbi:obscurin-like [Uloborus diversus]|uniref:obscurin-like n=1 Tax=Uloborus diversus TaxID=327109 RepID=UPI00240A4179|nr:obscurin-like [Uloborus diversus]
MDYTPRAGDPEGLPVSEGQEVEVIDSSKAHKWRVRLRQEGGSEGMVPSCYLEKKTTVTPSPSPQLDAKAQSAKARREKVLQELVESEEAFARDMQYVVNNYIREFESKTTPKELRDQKDALFSNFSRISEFHNNVLLKGIQYYADDPPRLGKTFLRLERDFDQHVSYCRDEPEAQQLLQDGALKQYFQEFSRKIQDEKSLSEHLKLPIQRINDYQLLLKELIKYGARLKEDTSDLERAHDFMQAIPQRIVDLQYINSIQGYKGNLHKLGRILKHDWFEVFEPSGMRRERFALLFKGRIFVTDHKRVGTYRSIYLVKHVIKLPEVEIVDNADDDDLKMRFQSLKPGASGYPLTMRSKSLAQKEDWLKEIQQSSGPHVEDLGDDEDDVEVEAAKAEELYERQKMTVEVMEDFDAYEEMHTVVTESVRSGSLTSLEDFQSALEDEPSLCLTPSEPESGGPGRPRFVQPLKAQAVSEGLEAVLECEICASPDATVAWLKDNAPYVSSERSKLVVEDGGRHRLLIKKAECSDAGLYTIIASNVHGTTSCSAPLTVSSGTKVFVRFADEGTSTAEALDDQRQWSPDHAGKEAAVETEESENFKVSIDEREDTLSLVFQHVTPGDPGGMYTCVASTGSGKISCSAELTVQGGLPRDPERPKLSAPVSKVEAKEGGSALLELTATGFPKPIITWTKDGEELKTGDGGKYAVLQEDDEETFTLAIKDVQPEDSGKYTAEAINDLGQGRSDLRSHCHQ